MAEATAPPVRVGIAAQAVLAQVAIVAAVTHIQAPTGAATHPHKPISILGSRSLGIQKLIHQAKAFG